MVILTSHLKTNWAMQLEWVWDSVSYDITKAVNKVELIVELESGTEYKYNASSI